MRLYVMHSRTEQAKFEVLYLHFKDLFTNEQEKKLLHEAH
jgi:hypothetical protein